MLCRLDARGGSEDWEKYLIFLLQMEFSTSGFLNVLC